ncbi:MAG: M20 family metallopeptidase [Actinomycetota bacterium]|jgi:amidohydrolase|nr:M20 family metallopeptidase [Acidimicrobiales bacterium]MEC8923310.1 M20 family metallopeptidase [Actinomycetota bacterium]MEC8976260.1 M20 family metallopeptidase [Actinomycetota bacterium]MED5173068.1 M20 family metallopeptidase [Actinomycetota bacterium]MED6305236.1 M20 family metallopeptidase [Actinomycetota bacterium]
MTLDPKETVASDNTAAADVIVDLSHQVWDTPEIAFEEYKTAAMTSRVLAEAGFEVETEITDLPTAWSATYGSGELIVTICAELDALPDIGHACGHNVIAAAGVGAGLALQNVADDLGITVRVLGTPAEEQGGGKILMLERGAFDGTNLAMMVHPAPSEGDRFPTLAISQCDFHFHGRTAHASVTPHLGVNAADAITVAQVGIGLLRQHLDPDDQVHGIVTKGGEAANIVPGNASARYFYRSTDLEALSRLEPRIRACFEAGATATGATLEIQPLGPPYSEFAHDLDLVDKYRKNAEALGRTFDSTPRKGAGSTDMANVSLLMPTIHPMLGLDSGSAVNHQPEFAAYCRTSVADQAAVEGALAMALTAVDAATDENTRTRLLKHDTSYSQTQQYPWTF